MDAIFFYSPDFTREPSFMVQDLQLKFASKLNETKQTSPAMFFNLFLSFNKIDNTLNQFLRYSLFQHMKRYKI